MTVVAVTRITASYELGHQHHLTGAAEHAPQSNDPIRLDECLCTGSPFGGEPDHDVCSKKMPSVQPPGR